MTLSGKVTEFFVASDLKLQCLLFCTINNAVLSPNCGPRSNCGPPYFSTEKYDMLKIDVFSHLKQHNFIRGTQNR